MIKFCTRCVYSNLHPLGITFDENGVCSGCKIHEEKDSLDWNYRFTRLKKIVTKYKSKTKKNYDCIVPVSGASDSHYILHIVKNKLGLNPLLVNYNKYFNTPIGIRNISNLRIKFDVDILFKNVNINSVKRLTKYSLLDYQNMYWPVLAGHTVYPVEVATKYKIPLIIWGAHQGTEQVGMFSHLSEVEMSRRYRHDHDLFGKESEDLINFENTLREEDLYNYKYPEDSLINKIGVKGIYLSNFIRWDPTAQHLKMIKKYNFRSAKLPRTFDTYEHIDCYNYMNIHDHTKLMKHGYSKITDHVCREIRHKRITRNEGIELIKFYQNQKIENLDLFANWLGVSEYSLNFSLNLKRNKLFWKQTDVRKYVDRTLIKLLDTKPLKKSKNKKNLNTYFKKKYKINLNEKKEYITFGKGFD